MKKALIGMLFLAGCINNPEAFIRTAAVATLAGVVANEIAGQSAPATGGAYAGGSYSGGADQLPNTTQCRKYMDHVMNSGPIRATQSNLKILVDLYHDCLNSAPNSAASMEYRCGPGKYYWNFGGGRRCGRI